jgi:hypothetical protein
MEAVTMKKILSILSGIALLTIASASNAGIITDTVSQNAFVDYCFFGDCSHSYTHNINDDGFTLGSALSGTLAIEIREDGDYLFPGEIIVFVVEEFDFDTGGITFTMGDASAASFSGELEVNALGALNADGLLDVTVVSILGDFYVGDSVLTVETADIPAPSALLLMSLGLLGLGFARKMKV